jgi:putative endonuclease
VGGAEAGRIGRGIEREVAAGLIAAGWTVLGANVRCGRAELDIVAVDPGPPPALVIVEVRWRRSRRFGLPEETLDARKRWHLREGLGWLLERGALPDGTPLPRLPPRIDLVAAEPGPDGARVVRHHRGLGG